ncbi:MAG: hypothetical protein AAF590_13110 [Pseudomonadota bacterium]
MSDQNAIFKEIYRQTERQIEVQLSVAGLRDQRSLVITGFSVVSSGFSLNAHASSAEPFFLVAALLFLVAAAFGALAAVPRQFYGGGYRFEELGQVADKFETEAALFASLAAKNDDYINANDEAEFASINLYRCALGVFFVGGLLAVIAILIQSRGTP